MRSISWIGLRFSALLFLSALAVFTPSGLHAPLYSWAPTDLTEPAFVANDPLSRLERPETQERLVAHISELFRRPAAEVRETLQAVVEAARETQLSPFLLLGMVAQESSFRPWARSSYGAVGLMQVVERFHHQKLKAAAEEHDATPIRTNVRVGSAILREYADRSGGDLDAALQRYSGKASEYPQKVEAYSKAFEDLSH